MADIFFSDLERTQVYRLPILPPTMPQLSRSAKNEEFETYNDGVYNLPGNVGLLSFSIECFLPALNKNYTFAKSKINPYLLVNLWAAAMNSKKPIRIIINRNTNQMLPIQALNMMVTVENMTWFEDQVGDVQYKIDLKEYREIK